MSKNNWMPWVPKKIFLQDVYSHYKNDLYTKKIIEKKLYIDAKINNNIQNTQKTIKDLKKSSFNHRKIKFLQEEAYQKGFTIGYEECKKNNTFLKDKIKKMFIDFENSLLACENVLFSHLLKIVLTVSAYVVGKNVDIDECSLLKCIKKVTLKDNFFLKKPNLVVNPCNKKIVENIFLDFLNMYNWKLVYDNNIDCNSCTVISESANIDATINARWQEVCRLVHMEENA